MGLWKTPAGLAIGTGTPQERAFARYGHLVDIGIEDSVRGVFTVLLVPMWYGKATTFKFRGEQKTVPLEDAVKDKSIMWSDTGLADIRYHYEDGYVVLDSVISSPRL